MAQGGRTVEILIAARDDTRAGLESAKANIRAMAISVAESQSAANAQWAKAHALRDAGNVGAARAAGLKAMELNNRAALQRQVADSISAMEQQAAAEDASARSASEQKVKLAIIEHRQRLALDDRYFALTHTQREVDLRNLQIYYERMRRQHAGNSSMLAQIDRTYAAEAAAINSGAAGRGGMMGGFFGARGMAKRELRFAAAGLLGIAGGEAGLAASALFSGSLIAGSIAATLLPIVKGYQAAKKGADDLAEAQKHHRDYLEDSARWAAKLAQEPTTETGQKFRQRADALRSRMDALASEMNKKAEENKGYWSDFVRGGYALFGESSPYEKAMQTGMAEHTKIEGDLRMLRKWSEEGEAVYAKRRRLMLEDAVTEARIAGMADGPRKRRIQLDREEKNEIDKLRDAFNDKFVEAQRAAEIEGRRLSAEEQSKLRRDYLTDKGFVERKYAEKRKNDELQYARETDSEINSIIRAQVEATEDGYKKEIELLKLKHLDEITEWEDAGRSINLLFEKQSYEREAIARRHEEVILALEQEHLQAIITSSFRGVEAERAAMNARHRYRLENAKDEDERQQVEWINEEERRRFDRDQADREKDLAYKVAAERLQLIQDQNQREQMMLLLRQQQRREAAEGESQEYRAMLANLDALEQAQLGQRRRHYSIPAVDRGFLTSAPGRYDPWAEFNRKQMLAIKEAEKGNRLNEKVITLLGIISEKVGVTDVKTADF